MNLVPEPRRHIVSSSAVPPMAGGLLLPLLGVALQQGGARSMPVWTHERLNTYVHCANASGPWSAAALSAIGRQQPRFVVQERCTGRFAAPANASAESKMLAAAAQITAVNSSIEVYMYNPVFPVVGWYSWGSAADAAADAGGALEIRWPNGTLYDWAACGDPAAARETCGGSRVVDFRNDAGRAAWVAGMVKTVAAGAISGVFIDGFRGGVGGGSAFAALDQTEGAGPPQHGLVLQHDGPDHLGLRCDALPEHQMALDHLGSRAVQTPSGGSA